MGEALEDDPDAAFDAAMLQTPSGATARSAAWGELPVVFAPLLTGPQGGISAHRDNLVRLLTLLPQWAGVLAVDEFAKRIVCAKPSPIGHAAGDEWTTDDDMKLSLWLTQQPRFMYRPGKGGELRIGQYVTSSLDTISQAVRGAACAVRTHPVRDYLDSLAWDGVPRAQRWLSTYLGAAATPYHGLVGRFFLINMVRRIYDPGCVMRSVPVLEGNQNIGKSRALRALAHPWFSDTMFRVGDKDAYLALRGVWLYEVSELDSFSRAEATAVKAFISSTEDNFRAPYERANARHQRSCVFAASTNASEYLQDFTGNTRFNPIECGAAIDLDALQRDRDQLLAEAVGLYRAGERGYPVRDESLLFEREVERRMTPHPWIDKLEHYVTSNVHSGGVTIGELMASGLGIDLSRVSPNGLEARKVGSIMQLLGWVKARPRVDGGREWRYYRPEHAPRIGRPADYDDSPAAVAAGPDNFPI
jgi:predicted P-loop ATPase